MNRLVAKPLIAAISALALLGACGNAASDSTAVLFKTALSGAFSKKAAPQPISPAAAARALSATSAPIALVVVEKTKGQALIVEIGRNGPYRTYGTASRESLTLRRGMITASRGLGGDLMSSDVDELLPLVSGRQRGIAEYKMRFLNGEDVTYTYTYTCATHVEGSIPVAAGLINETGTAVNAICTGDGPSFTNTFVVGRDGQILGSQQWLGPVIGNLLTQHLRR